MGKVNVLLYNGDDDERDAATGMIRCSAVEQYEQVVRQLGGGALLGLGSGRAADRGSDFLSKQITQ